MANGLRGCSIGLTRETGQEEPKYRKNFIGVQGVNTRNSNIQGYFLKENPGLPLWEANPGIKYYICVN